MRTGLNRYDPRAFAMRSTLPGFVAFCNTRLETADGFLATTSATRKRTTDTRVKSVVLHHSKADGSTSGVGPSRRFSLFVSRSALPPKPDVNALCVSFRNFNRGRSRRGVERACRALVTTIPTAMDTALVTVSIAATTGTPRFFQYFQELVRCI
jgi:hypothetical protein